MPNRKRPQPVFHACSLFTSPWPGVFGTDIESARAFGRHWHTTFGFGLMERGAHRSISDSGVVDAHAGDVIAINPGEVHDGRPLGAHSRRWRLVYLEPELVATLAAERRRSGDVRLTRPTIRDRTLIRPLRSLLGRLERWSASRPHATDETLACEEALVLACGQLLDRYSTATLTSQVQCEVARVRERLADDLAHAASLSELAALVGLSRYQLLRRFASVYGMTPFAWQRKLRTERARALVARGRNLADVAAECGFADQSHMTRVFADHFGFTPGAVAASLERSSGPRDQTRNCIQDG
jgi:AraC-like DNA-binding protein